MLNDEIKKKINKNKCQIMKLKNIKGKKNLGMWAWVTLRSKPFKKTLMHILARLASIFCYFFLKSE